MKPIQTSGKRKSAVARATLHQGTGIIRINGVPIPKIQPRLARLKIEELLIIAEDEKLKTVNIDVKTQGGGVLGQIDAARIALTRGILKFLNKKRIIKAIRVYDKAMISGDKRRIEPKHWGGKKARKRTQKSFR
jgi:small subunit ribosomal protein S9